MKTFDFIGYDDNNVYIIYLKPQINELNYNEILISSIIDTFIINSFNNNYDDDDDSDVKNNNISKFKDKKIFTIIFSLNTNEYIKLDWGNLINDNNDELKKLFIEDIMSVYLNDEIYYYYKYYRNKYNNKDIINNIRNDISKHISNQKKNNLPNFIINFFDDIYRNVYRYKTDTLDNYDNIDYFNEKLKEIIKDELYNYFDIKEQK
jgi:hypothetical protein